MTLKLKFKFKLKVFTISSFRTKNLKRSICAIAIAIFCGIIRLNGLKSPSCNKTKNAFA